MRQCFRITFLKLHPLMSNLLLLQLARMLNLKNCKGNKRIFTGAVKCVKCQTSTSMKWHPTWTLTSFRFLLSARSLMNTAFIHLLLYPGHRLQGFFFYPHKIITCQQSTKQAWVFQVSPALKSHTNVHLSSFLLGQIIFCTHCFPL